MAKPFTPLDPDAQLGYLVARVADQVAKPWSASLRAHGINPRQFSILALLAHDSTLSQGELARRVLITPQSMSESLASLEREGFIARGQPAPGRAMSLQLSAKGRKLLTLANPLVEDSNRESFAALTPKERATLARLLHKLLV
jgi:DNA-binding MarR family transcriptional regulator